MSLKKLLYLRTNDHAQLIIIYVMCILSDVAYINKSSTILCKSICAYVYVYARLRAYMYVYAHVYFFMFICVYSRM